VIEKIQEEVVAAVKEEDESPEIATPADQVPVPENVPQPMYPTQDTGATFSIPASPTPNEFEPVDYIEELSDQAKSDLEEIPF
jgi:hypothetical protein